MTPTPNQDRHAASAQTYARTAAVLMLLSLLAGGFGEAYVPSRLIVSSDATATAHNLQALQSLFRLGFVGYLIEATCDIALSLLFYVLLRPVRKNIALLAAFLGLVSTASFAAAELFYLAPSLILSGAPYLNTFTPAQLNSLALLSFKLFTFGGMMFTAFYGVAWILRGYLIFRSAYLPKFLGVLMALGGLAFITRNLLLTLAPSFPSGAVLLLMLPGGLALPLWLLTKGIDLRTWKEQATTTDPNV